MIHKHTKKFGKLTIFIVVWLVFFSSNLSLDGDWQAILSVQAAPNLHGRILLQVQDKGQAWYVNPVNGQRYYLGRPDDAFLLMRSLGLGVSNTDIDSFKGYAPARLAGRILLQVQDKGQAFYVSPINYQLHYLGRPADAFKVMRSQGLGITNLDLEEILVFSEPVTEQTIENISYEFKYQNTDYTLDQDLSVSLYDKYSRSTKTLTYSSANPPLNLRDSFYKIFLTTQLGDKTIDTLATKLKSIATEKGWSSDQLVEFSLALIQYIPYDHEKISANDNRNTNPYYPYETLFLNRGVCSDKTFLAVALLRKLGYGAAILDFPDSNHSAVGVACPLSDSLAGSGYCYGETTNFFPIGVVPQSISSGQAQAQSEFSVSFDASNLGTMEIYQASSGLNYQGLTNTKSIVKSIQEAQLDLKSNQALIKQQESEYSQKEAVLGTMKADLDIYLSSGQTSAYNQLVPEYNNLVKEYNAGLAVYQENVKTYNNQVAELNRAMNDFYQK